jgi:hypothetical protein
MARPFASQVDFNALAMHEMSIKACYDAALPAQAPYSPVRYQPADAAPRDHRQQGSSIWGPPAAVPSQAAGATIASSMPPVTGGDCTAAAVSRVKAMLGEP